MQRMQAIQFESIVDDGVIHIPDEYVEQVAGQVKVILLSEATSLRKTRKPFAAISINTKGFKFNRDEANAR